MTAGWAVLTGQLGVFTGRAKSKLPTGEPTNLKHDYATSSVQALQREKVTDGWAGAILLKIYTLTRTYTT